MPRGANCRVGCIFQFLPTQGSILPFFFPERECIGNYPSDSWGVMTVYIFHTLPLYKRECILPKNLDIWDQKSTFCIVIAIFVNRAYHQYARGYKFIFQDSPMFLAVSGLCHFAIISTLNSRQLSTKLGETVRVALSYTL